MFKDKKVICFFNSIVNISGLNIAKIGFSGGDVRFIEIFKRIKTLHIIIITSLIGKTVCKLNKIDAKYILTTKELHTKNILFTDFLRIFKTLFIKININDCDVIYSSSDFFMDTFPAYLLKLRNKKAKWIICIFLILPTLFKDYSKYYIKNSKNSFPTFKHVLYFLSQQFTIFVGKTWADKILVLNELDKKYLIKHRKVNASKIMVVNGGVDYVEIDKIIVETSIFDGIFLGRFHQQKGIFDLIKIWKLVCNKKPNAKLCIIGSGPESIVKKLISTINENNLSNNIYLVGLKTGDEKFILLKSSKLFLCPSYYESFAIVISEAMACGLPVIAYNLPIYENIYHDKIISIPIGDINQFTNIILKYLTNDQLRSSVGLSGKNYIKKYDWNIIAEKESYLLWSE